MDLSIQPNCSVFAIDYGFTHVTSNSYYPQDDGATERGVRTMKTFEDPYVFSFTSPLENGYSSTELLLSMKLRTTIPMIPKQLSSCLPVKSLVKEKEEKIRERQQNNFK